MPTTPPLLRTSYEVARLARITYRQLDHWTRKGWVVPIEEHTGSGVPRHFTNDETEHVRIMAELVHAGFAPVDAYMITQWGERDAGGVFRASVNDRVVVEVWPNEYHS